MEHQQFETRGEYLTTQITASAGKAGFCKVSYQDVRRYVEIIETDKHRRREPAASTGPTLCLGVRNGREIDLFRIAQSGSRLMRFITARLERQVQGFRSYLPFIESQGRSRVERIEKQGWYGVELNPDARRPDVWNGSFDELPKEWDGVFEILYTNAFDHAFDPHTTVTGWKRVVKSGGYIILGFPNDQVPSKIDPVGNVTLRDVIELFGGEVIYYHLRGSAWRYTEYVIRMP
jgi:hypothetical protein